MARSLTTEEWCVLVRLERWRAELDVVLRFLGDRAVLSGAEAEAARRRFGCVKDGLRRESDLGTKLTGYRKLSDLERRWYQPAIRMAYCALQSKVNTRPGNLWFQELSAARETINHAIRPLAGFACVSDSNADPANDPAAMNRSAAERAGARSRQSNIEASELGSRVD